MKQVKPKYPIIVQANTFGWSLKNAALKKGQKITSAIKNQDKYAKRFEKLARINKTQNAFAVT